MASALPPKATPPKATPPKATPLKAVLPSLAVALRSHCDANTQRVREVLAESCYSEIRRLKCETHNNIVTVSGRLPSFYKKQVAISLVIHCLQKGAVRDHNISVDVVVE